MGPASNSSATAAAANGGFWHWNSPLPFLFGGLALLLGLMSMALLILACSFKKTPTDDHEEKSQHRKEVELKVENMEPKIVVIMAGDDNPTYLANPVACTCQGEQV